MEVIASEGLVDNAKARGQQLIDGLNAIDGVVCPHPEGTFYAFPAIAREWGDSADVAERLLEHSGVLLTPGSAYGAASRYHLRLSFATSVDIIEEGMTRLRAAAANF